MGRRSQTPRGERVEEEEGQQGQRRAGWGEDDWRMELGEGVGKEMEHCWSSDSRRVELEFRQEPERPNKGAEKRREWKGKGGRKRGGGRSQRQGKWLMLVDVGRCKKKGQGEREDQTEEKEKRGEEEGEDGGG